MGYREEQGAVQGGTQGAVTGAAVSGGNPWVAGAGGIIGMATGYIMAERQEAERKKAEEANQANVTYENLYAPFFKQSRRLNPTGQAGDPAAGAAAGAIQGLEQGGRFAQMKYSYDKNQAAKEKRARFEKINQGNPYDDNYPRQAPNQDPYYRGHPSYNPDAGNPLYA